MRFSTILDPSAANFHPVPAAACLLDPSVAPVLMSAEVKPLFDAAKMFIFNEVTRHFLVMHCAQSSISILCSLYFCNRLTAVQQAVDWLEYNLLGTW